MTSLLSQWPIHGTPSSSPDSREKLIGTYTHDHSIKYWDRLRATLLDLENKGIDPQSAIVTILPGLSGSPETNSPPLDVSSMSRFKSRLGTNYVPSESERRQIQEFCALEIADIERLRQMLDAVADTHSGLAAKSAAKHAALHPYLALLSPIRAMPVEILQNIFIACLPTTHNAIIHASEPPLLFGRVCSTWRTVSFATAELWSSVHVVVPCDTSDPGLFLTPVTLNDTQTESLSRRCEGFKAWLTRSGNCPLSVSLFVSFRCHALTRPFVEALLPHSRRWKALNFQRVPLELSPLCSLTSNDVPMLESLGIADGVPGREILNLFSTPPRLHSISIHCATSQVDLPKLSWCNITTLSLHSLGGFFRLDLNQAMDIIRQCVNLQICDLVFPGPDVQSVPSSPNTNSLVILPRLHTLSVRAELFRTCSFNLDNILGRFVVPALTHFTVTGSSENLVFMFPVPTTPDIFSTLETLVLRSSCPLLSLTILDVTGDYTSLVRVLRQSTALTSLHLSYSRLKRFLLPNLTQVLRSLTVADPPLCPHLRNIHLHHADTPHRAAHDTLLAFLRSRSNPPPHRKIACLNTVRVFLAYTAKFDVAEATRELGHTESGVLSILIQEPLNSGRAGPSMGLVPIVL
ncbi:hypothetical protein C8J57DRAFT_346027 [Mycena rebaudengoi]|nr:hypothetical protein C8J57DRAFT_346027 [Mycena rebaudengoi]